MTDLPVPGDTRPRPLATRRRNSLKRLVGQVLLSKVVPKCALCKLFVTVSLVTVSLVSDTTMVAVAHAVRHEPVGSIFTMDLRRGTLRAHQLGW